jgi:DNA-binding beta-propeller fold protein YncE
MSRYAALTAAVLLMIAAPAAASPYVYAPNQSSDLVSQFELGPGAGLASLAPAAVPAGDEPRGVAVSPDGASVYVTNDFTNDVSQFDVGPGGRLAPKDPALVNAGIAPLGVAVSPDGDSVYVANSGVGTLSQFDVAAGGELTPKSPATVAAGEGVYWVAVSPGGTSVYATDNAGAVWQYDVGAGGALTPKTPAGLAVGTDPRGIAISPDGGSVYVADHATGDVLQFDVGAGGGLTPKTPASVDSGSGELFQLTVSPDGSSVYVADFSGNRVLQYDVGTGGKLAPKSPASVAAVSGPYTPAMSPDGASLYVTNNGGEISQYDVGAGGALSAKSPAVVSAGSGPFGIAVGPPECSDTRDNDGDGDADFPDDAQCASALDGDEASFLFGRGAAGTSFSAISRDVKRASPHLLWYGGATVTALRVHMDGGGAATGSQDVRAIIYRHTGSGDHLVAQSVPQTILAGRPAGFVDFALSEPVELGVGYYLLGIHSGNGQRVARFSWTSKPSSRIYNGDLFADGASDPFGSRRITDDQEIAIQAVGSVGGGVATN